MRVIARKAAILVRHTAGVILTSGVMWLAGAQPAAATQQFATQTGQTCGQCHVIAKGGGALTPAGQAFKANGNKAPAESSAPGSAAPKTK